MPNGNGRRPPKATSKQRGKRKPRSRQDDAKIEHRRRQVAAMLLTLHNPSVRRVRDALTQLPEPLTASKSTIHRDIVTCRDEWVTERFRDMDEVIGEELAKLSMAEEATWRALHRSARPSVKTFTRTREIMVDGEPRTLTNTYTETVERETDPRLLRALTDIMERRAKMIGLDAPKGIDLSSNGKQLSFTVDIGAPDWAPVVLPKAEEERLMRLEAGTAEE